MLAALQPVSANVGSGKESEKDKMVKKKTSSLNSDGDTSATPDSDSEEDIKNSAVGLTRPKGRFQ